MFEFSKNKYFVFFMVNVRARVQCTNTRTLENVDTCSSIIKLKKWLTQTNEDK